MGTSEGIGTGTPPAGPLATENDKRKLQGRGLDRVLCEEVEPRGIDLLTQSQYIKPKCPFLLHKNDQLEFDVSFGARKQYFCVHLFTVGYSTDVYAKVIIVHENGQNHESFF